MSNLSTVPSLLKRDPQPAMRLTPVKFNNRMRNHALGYGLVAAAMFVVACQHLMDWFVFYDAYVAHVEWAYAWLWLLAFAFAMAVALCRYFYIHAIDNWLDWSVSINVQTEGCSTD